MVDNGTVSYSNPVRQSLFTFEVSGVVCLVVVVHISDMPTLVSGHGWTNQNNNLLGQKNSGHITPWQMWLLYQ